MGFGVRSILYVVSCYVRVTVARAGGQLGKPEPVSSLGSYLTHIHMPTGAILLQAAP